MLEANITTANRLAEALNVSLAYFYTVEDEQVPMILLFSEISTKQQTHVLSSLGNDRTEKSTDNQ